MVQDDGVDCRAVDMNNPGDVLLYEVITGKYRSACELLETFWGNCDRPETLAELLDDLEVFERDLGWIMSEAEVKRVINYLELE